MAITDLGVLRGWGGHDLLDRDGVKAGSIIDLYIDEQTEQPTWGLVRTGLLGSRQTLVPLTRPPSHSPSLSAALRSSCWWLPLRDERRICGRSRARSLRRVCW